MPNKFSHYINYKIYFLNIDILGSIGVVVGGIVSDKIVAKMGIKSRVAVLAISQLISTPGAFGSVYFEPVWAMITLGISYFFGEFKIIKFIRYRSVEPNIFTFQF